MLRRLCLVLALFAALSMLGRCARARIRPAGEILTVCLSTYDAHALSIQASVVRELRRQGTVLWLVLGDQFADQWLTAATDGAGPVRLLSAAGVDAVLLTPEWLSFGRGGSRSWSTAPGSTSSVRTCRMPRGSRSGIRFS